MAIINDALTRVFHYVGGKIAHSPKYYIIGPILLSAILATGLFQLVYVNDTEYLYTQSSGRSQYEREVVARLFPPNYTDRFDPSRLAKIGRFARIIVMTKEEGNMLSAKTWGELEELNNLIEGTIVDWRHNKYNYSTMCAKWHEDCYENKFLDLGDLIKDVEEGKTRISYPIMFNPKTYNAHVLPQYFGGVNLTNDGYSVDSVKAILLHYFVTFQDDDDTERGQQWEINLLKRLDKADAKWKHIKVYRLTWQTFSDAMDENVFSIVPHFVVTIIIMAFFVMGSSMMNDWVTSKPLLAAMGIISALLGTAAGSGLVAYLGVPFMGINMALPFIMIGIGVDDTFVMLASWRRTSPDDSVSKRMAECFSEAAVSITITTITDMVSFYVGILTPIPSVQIFSAYAGTCIIFIYLYQVFFFGAFMAISGYHEKENRHSVLWWKQAVPKSKAESMSSLYRIFMSGGKDDGQEVVPGDDENPVMVYFRDTFSPFICKKWVKAVVLITFVIYVGIACFGVTTLDEGFRTERVARYDSYMTEYIKKEFMYFRDYPHRIQVIIQNPLDYSQNETQQKVENLLKKFYDTPMVSEEWNENWFRDFTRYINNHKEFYDFNISTEAQFIDTLRNEFLNERTPISQDIRFNEDKTKIIATRYIIQSMNVTTLNAEKDLLLELRHIAAEAEKDGLEVVVYHPWFRFTDQFIIIRDLAIKLVSVAAIITIFVALFFIPNLVCSISVLFTIVSIELGVIGFMSLWDVSLDLISVICLIMCIGFSVDFSAHISYAYISSEGDTSEEKIRGAMYSLGLPISQGAISTIIGVAAMVAAPSYIFHTFFKVVVLVILFATWHALFLLPVLFSIFRPERVCSKRKSYTIDNRVPQTIINSQSITSVTVANSKE